MCLSYADALAAVHVGWLAAYPESASLDRWRYYVSHILGEPEMAIVLLNLLYALLGGGAAIAFMFVGYKVIDHLTPFDTAEQLAAGNRAIGTMVGGMFVGIGIAIGLVVGLGLN